MEVLTLHSPHSIRDRQDVKPFYDPAYNPFSRPAFLHERLIPLVKNKKVPHKGFKYKHLHEHTPQQLEAWMHEFQTDSWGVRCGWFSVRHGWLTVIDIDKPQLFPFQEIPDVSSWSITRSGIQLYCWTQIEPYLKQKVFPWGEVKSDRGEQVKTIGSRQDDWVYKKNAGFCTTPMSLEVLKSLLEPTTQQHVVFRDSPVMFLGSSLTPVSSPHPRSVSVSSSLSSSESPRDSSTLQGEVTVKCTIESVQKGNRYTTLKKLVWDWAKWRRGIDDLKFEHWEAKVIKVSISLWKRIPADVRVGFPLCESREVGKRISRELWDNPEKRVPEHFKKTTPTNANSRRERGLAVRRENAKNGHQKIRNLARFGHSKVEIARLTGYSLRNVFKVLKDTRS